MKKRYFLISYNAFINGVARKTPVHGDTALESNGFPSRKEIEKHLTEGLDTNEVSITGFHEFKSKEDFNAFIQA